MSGKLVPAGGDIWKLIQGYLGGGTGIIAPYIPVSYTHLDVYKRQRLDCLAGKTV